MSPLGPVILPGFSGRFQPIPDFACAQQVSAEIEMTVEETANSGQVPWWVYSEPVSMHAKVPMDTYDPLNPPDPCEWLSMDEDERIELAIAHHRKAGVELPNEQIHGAVHTIVENQIALGDEIPIRANLDRLVKEGLDRHEAVHAIGSVLVEFLQDTLNNDESAPNINKSYYQELDKLKAAEWLKSFE